MDRHSRTMLDRAAEDVRKVAGAMRNAATSDSPGLECRSQAAIAVLGRIAGIWTNHVIGDGEVDSVGLILPASGAEHAIVPAVSLSDTRTLNRVPVVNTAVHDPVGHKALPLVARPHDDALL